MTDTREPAIGVVQKVFVHDDAGDSSNHEVNVRLVNNEEELRRIPIHVGRSGHTVVPHKNDAVEVNFLGSEGQSGYVSDFVYTAEDRAPLARSGHYRHRFGDSSPYLFIEAEPTDHSGGTPDVVRLAKKEDGLSDPIAEVSIDDSGASTDININVNGGTINITSDGSIKLGDPDGTFKEVARKGDSVEAFDPDSGMIDGEITEGSANVEST
jgi:hypothetical protein